MAKTDEEIVLFESNTGNTYIIYKSGSEDTRKKYRCEIMWAGESEWCHFDECSYMPHNMIYTNDIIHLDER